MAANETLGSRQAPAAADPAADNNTRANSYKAAIVSNGGAKATNSTSETSASNVTDQQQPTIAIASPVCQSPVKTLLKSPRKLTDIQQIKVVVRVCNALAVALGAYVGVAIRFGCALIVDRYSHFSDVLPEIGDGFYMQNIIGSLLLGFVANYACEAAVWPVVKAGVGTGLCGSCTTFASWQLFVSIGLLKTDVIDMVTISVITVATSYCAYLWGKQLAEWYNKCRKRVEETAKSATNNARLTELQNGNESDVEGSKQLMGPEPINLEPLRYPATLTALAVVFVMVTIVLLTLSIALPYDQAGQHICLAILGGPVGALTRYFLSLWNPGWPRFPLFTFIANVGATALAMCVVVTNNAILQHPTDSAQPASPSSESGLPVGVLVLKYTIGTGACGSLSTVSTWIGELYTLANRRPPLRNAYVYGLSSVAAAQTLALIIGGLYSWLTAQTL